MTASWWPEIRDGDLLAGLGQEEQARLRTALDPFAVAPGDLILKKGDASHSLILLEEGQIEVYEESMGEAVVLATLGAGAVVGEVGFVDGRPRTHHVRAVSRCRLQRLSRERLLDLGRGDPALFAKLVLGLAQLIAQRFRAAVAELEPVRAFAASLGEPMAEPLATEAPASFDEIEDALPEVGPAGLAEALELLKDVGRRSGKGLAGL